MSTGYVSGDDGGQEDDDDRAEEKVNSRRKPERNRSPKEQAQVPEETQNEDVPVSMGKTSGEFTVRDVIEELVRLKRSGGLEAKEGESHDQIVIEVNGKREKVPGSAPLTGVDLERIIQDKLSDKSATIRRLETLLVVLSVLCVVLLAYVANIWITIPDKCITDVGSNVEGSKKATHGLSDSEVAFQDRLNELKKRFPSQDESLWSSLSDVLAPNATTNPCSMLSLTSSEPFASSPTAEPTLTELASALPWIMARQHFILHHRQFTVMNGEHAREAIKDIMQAWYTDVIVIPDVNSMPSDVMNVIRATCQSNGAGQVVVTTSEEKPEIADTFSIAVRPERTESPLEHITLENPEEGLSAIRWRFPSQTDRVWQVVRAAILSHIAETDPVKPAVVIIGAPPGAHRTADQLAQALARIYAEKSITIDSRQFAQVNAARAKLHLDRVLEPGLLGSDRRESGVLGSARAVVLTRLEALPGDAAMLFHGYCDHSDAQYKGAAYFFTVHCSEEIDPTLHYKQQERMVHQHLQRAWRNLPVTHLDPLLGRITPLTTVVTPEGEMELSKE